MVVEEVAVPVTVGEVVLADSAADSAVWRAISKLKMWI